MFKSVLPLAHAFSVKNGFPFHKCVSGRNGYDIPANNHVGSTSICFSICFSISFIFLEHSLLANILRMHFGSYIGNQAQALNIGYPRAVFLSIVQQHIHK